MIDKVIDHFAYLIVNLVIISICKLFLPVPWLDVVIYSIVNSLWMPFVLRPKERDIAKELEPLAAYFKDFKNKQKRIELEIDREEKINRALFDVYKRDWKLFRVYIRKHQIASLYHFTDRENIASIRKNSGLYSWHYCLNNNVDIKRPGGDVLSRTLDRRYNLENYVRLSLAREHPMVYAAMKTGRIVDPVILKIDPEIIFLKRTMFSNTNATKSNKEIGETFDYFNKIKFEVIRNSYLDVDDFERPYYQAEILVLESIPLNYITNIKDYD
jgi:hypothetical protein